MRDADWRSQDEYSFGVERVQVGSSVQLQDEQAHRELKVRFKQTHEEAGLAKDVFKKQIAQVEVEGCSASE